MAQTNTTKTRDGKKVFLYRAHTDNSELSSTQYLPASQFLLGIDQETPQETDTEIDHPIPINTGAANDDGSNTFIGSLGGEDSTDNTTSFKYGAGTTDDTSQNLNTNNSSISKVWTIADITTYGTAVDENKYGSIWLYIKDQTTLDYFSTSGEAVRVGWGDDSSNYHYKTWTATELSIGWNWLTTYSNSIGDLSSIGSPSPSLIYFRISITTNNATDTWSEGDVLYDLLHTYDDTNLVKDFVSGYPTLNLNSLEATTRIYVTSVEANGFNINGVAERNEDATELTTGLTEQTEESKEPTDEFAWVFVDRVL